jgi:serine/threonine-protein kinase
MVRRALRRAPPGDGLTRGLKLAVLALCLACPRQARADNTQAAAQELFDQGKRLMASGRIAEACPRFEESQRLDPALGTLLNLADCYEQQRRLPEAWSKFFEAAQVARSEAHPDAERVAEARATTIAAGSPKLLIQVGAAPATGLEIRRNGALLPASEWGIAVPLKAGPYTIAASAPGRQTWQAQIVVPSGTGTSALSVPALSPLPLSPAPASAPTGLDSPEMRAFRVQRIAAAAVFGAGVVGLTVGSVFGLKALSKNDDADQFCNGARCTDPAGVALKSEAHQAGTISTVAFVLGAAGVAGGATLWLTAKPPQASANHRLRLHASFAALTLEGSF